jgi:predicted  nucleic acid-binding Zn-ribbon protein
MNSAALLALQEIDSALTVIDNKRPRLPEVAAHRAASDALAAHQERMADAQRRIDEATAAIETTEHASADLVTKRTRLEGQLKTIIAPREAEALMHQIDTINGQRSDLDDQELVSLDLQAQAEAELAELSSALPALAESAALADEQLRVATEALDAEAADLHVRRPDAAAALTEEELAAYERARKHFNGVAITHLEGTHCHGCHLDLSPAELDEVKATPVGQLPECPQCGRYLVR